MPEGPTLDRNIELQRLLQEPALLEKAQEVAHVGSWVAELDGSDRLAWSAEAHRIFGIEPGQFEGTCDAFLTHVYEEDRPAVRAARRHAIADGSTYEIEHRVVRSDGSVRWVLERADVVRNGQGRPLRMIGTVQDITERRQIEDHLRHGQKMEAIGKLAGGIAHDLNNALTAIAGYADLALNQLTEHPGARSDVEEIRRAAERASSVTRQLLAFSRKQLIEPRLFDLNTAIQALGRLLGRLLGPNIEIMMDLGRSLPPVLGDPGQIEQAVLNLAVNARDAMPNGGLLTFATSLEDVDESFARGRVPMIPGRYVMLRVTDTGQGMAPETLDRIFEPFFTTKEPGKGTGLGLSMVYGTLKQIGGFIFADSVLGQGTTFRLYVPPADRERDSGGEHLARLGHS